jgi:hypothetical protein
MKNLPKKSVRRRGSRFGAALEYSSLELRQLLDGAGLNRDGFWQEFDPKTVNTVSGQPLLTLNQFSLFGLKESSMLEALVKAPLEYSPGYRAQLMTISVPRPDSSLAQFRVFESPIMEPELAAQFPDIKTYSGIGIDDPSATIRFDVTVHGFRAQVLSPNGNYYVDPYFKGQTDYYASYSRAGVTRDPDAGGCGCGVCAACQVEAELKGVKEDVSPVTPHNFGTQLRTLRLANAATGEYTAYWGGSVAQGQAAIVTAVNRVTGIYEKDLAIRLVLVANNSSLVYTNSATDPYTNNSGSTMLGQNQTTVDSVIGNANYDIGHVFSTGGGGVAGLGVVGTTGSKARGVTGSPAPTGDPFYVDYVAHEMGHQFGASHTFNGTGGSCSGNRSSSSAYEPGSGTSIMAYAGICGADNVQSNSDSFFHSRSIEQIRSLIDSRAVGTTTNTGNSVPSVATATGFVIPAQTPFELTATGNDSDAANVLSYSWEQRNLGAAVALSAADNGASPLFRSYNPTTNPTRVFPRLANLLANSVPVGEKLPTLNWSAMNFRVVVRDNSVGGGGVNTANMSMQVVATGAAFEVTSQNSATTWAGGSQQSISWNVAGTTASPINAANVDIWLSTDGGNNFSTLLASATPNDGSHTITVPNLSTNLARIKIKATGNVFFDINNINFSVVPAATITNQYVYYPGSSYATGGVQAALDTSKVVAKEISTPQILGFANLTNTTRGINGLVFDIDFMPANSLTGSDFLFQWSPQGDFDTTDINNAPLNWQSVTVSPTLINVSNLGGNSKRIRLEWADNQIQNRWLRTTLVANANTGLAQSNVFYIGHLLGEVSGLQSGNSITQPHQRFLVSNLSDVSLIRQNLNSTVPVTNPFDLNKNGVVQNLGDVTGARDALNIQLTNIEIPGSQFRYSERTGGRGSNVRDAGRNALSWVFGSLGNGFVEDSPILMSRSLSMRNRETGCGQVDLDANPALPNQGAPNLSSLSRLETTFLKPDGKGATKSAFPGQISNRHLDGWFEEGLSIDGAFKDKSRFSAAKT